MASIQKSGKNSWRLQIDLGYDVNGKRLYKRKTISVENAEAMKKLELKRFLDNELSKFKIEVEVGEYISPDKMRFDQFVIEWQKKFVEKQLEQSSQRNYNSIVKNRLKPYFGHKRMDQIQTFHIMSFIDTLDAPDARLDGRKKLISSAAKVYTFRVLRSIFAKALEWKIIKTNPMIGATKPKEKSIECEVYDEKEIKFILSALRNEHPDFRMMATLALVTGLRRGELVALEWQCVDLKVGTIEVKQSLVGYQDGQPILKSPKTKNSLRKVAIPHFIIKELEEFQALKRKEKMKVIDKWQGDGHNFVFCTIFGKAFSGGWATQRWYRLHQKLKGQIKYIRFHDMRHTSATLLINQGVHAKVISERLGHSNIGTTMNVYGHVLRSADHAAASKFDFLFETKNDNKHA